MAKMRKGPYVYELKRFLVAFFACLVFRAIDISKDCMEGRLLAKTAAERIQEKKEPKRVLLDKDFAGVKKGQWLFVATPKIVADYISKIPAGEIRTIERMRRELAKRRGCDASCPVSTAVFVRIAAEAAIDAMNDGKSITDVIPFWRVISGQDKVAKKLAIDPEWIDQQRILEAEEA